MIKVGTLVQVDWLDAEAEALWTAIKDVTRKPDEVHSVGFVLEDNEACIVIAADVGNKFDPEQTVNRTMVIPRGMIVKVRRLS